MVFVLKQGPQSVFWIGERGETGKMSASYKNS